MKYFLSFFAFLYLSIQVYAQNSGITQRPKLVVGIVVDQMRYDFLYKYIDKYNNKGFKKLLGNGYTCENTMINYLPSYTGPGHTCIYTGSVPSIHGIASNDWYDRATGKAVYCTQDTAVANVGGTPKAGKMSPRNLHTTTITDELRLAQNFKNKTIAISLKDRASILPGGHTANAAYWMDDTLGNFMTSTYYMQQLPTWVSDFNLEEHAKKYMQQGWNTMLPIEEYTMSTDDNNKYEGKFLNEKKTDFPHSLLGLKYADIKKTPFGNSVVVDFVKEAIINEQLGKTEYTDFLAISFSSPDYVGHMYGPNSVEIEDTYIRLDDDIASLLNTLNKEVGKENYVLFLTADHGAAHNPQFLIDNKIQAGYFFGKKFKKELNDFLYTKYNDSTIVHEVGENFIWYNHALIEQKKYNKQNITDDIIAYCLQKEEIQFASDMTNPQKTLMPSPLKEMAINGYDYKRSGDILLIYTSAYLDAYASTGTSHGAWNTYDTHIPLIWYGKNIEKGTLYRTCYMTDIAATIASMLQIQMPNGCIGSCITEVLQK